ncbi:IS30 family transposase [Collinsella sp. An2]|uniref:IS30 family transposase n=1 Tax=Collinsella sp. An2 TaxID=1965585 RepID=UPI000B3957DE|nr:IS30 family transposase [Collinsella sp. An2]OUP05744.1 IS30 family transposase [Collinsella sp. An2]
MAKVPRTTAGRAYSRLTRHERNQIERMLDRGKGAREIARELGRSPSTVANEVARHRFVTAPRSMYGEPAPADLSGACERLQSWPRCCNGCRRRRGYGCSRKPRVFYSARMAQAAADAELSGSRRGIDETEGSVAAKLSTIRSCLARGLSPQQIAALHPELGISASTVYRWVDAGYAEMTNLDLRRKVGYKKRSRKAPGRPTRHSARRSHDEFARLPEDERASAWEMDTVEGSAADSARLLTLYHRPTSFQLAIPVEDGTCGAVKAGLGLVRAALGADGVGRVFGLVLTDNGAEFSDEGGIAALLGEAAGETRLYYCEPRRADQKGGCERNHVEIRKMLPKGRGIRLDRLTRADAALVMSQVNSEPRGKLAWRTPSEMLLAAFGEDARALLDAFGVEALAPSELDLTPACVERARAGRGEAPLAG